VRRTKTVLAISFSVVAASIAVGVGVANASTVHEQTPVVATARQAQLTRPADAKADDLAHWSKDQHTAAIVAGNALEKKFGAVKVLGAGSVGKPGIYVTKWITPAKGSWNVTVDIPTKSVASIAKA
jgi:hypothetical protein